MLIGQIVIESYLEYWQNRLIARVHLVFTVDQIVVFLS